YREGITLFNKGMYEQAAEELQYFIDKHPNNPLTASASFHYIRSLAMVNPAHKAAYYNRYIRMNPNSDYAQKLLFNLAHEAKKAENYDKAIEYYQQVLAHNTTK